MALESDQSLLTSYHAARDMGDVRAAAATWERLAVQNFDRIKQTVNGFRFSPGGPKLPASEWGSAATEAYLRVQAMGGSFEKREVGQFYAALHTAVHPACLDYGRKELRHDKRSAGSIDKTYDPDGEAGPFDRALAAYDAQLRENAAEAREAEARRVGAEQLIAWAIGKVENDNYREVLEMTYIQKIPAEEISERLGISLANVYARRSRGLRELERILRGDGS
jgi:RNA polymerase sigma factor (sigma-70 family)